MLVKLKEDKLGSRSGRSSDLSPSAKSASGDREKDDLKKQIKQLETKLSGINKAEKPLESLVPLPEDMDQPKDSIEKQVSNKIMSDLEITGGGMGIGNPLFGLHGISQKKWVLHF